MDSSELIYVSTYTLTIIACGYVPNGVKVILSLTCSYVELFACCVNKKINSRYDKLCLRESILYHTV